MITVSVLKLIAIALQILMFSAASVSIVAMDKVDGIMKKAFVLVVGSIIITIVALIWG